MKRTSRWMVLGLMIVASLQLVACTQATVKASKIAPVKVEAIEGTNLKRLTLVPEAAKRIEIQTATVREEQVVRQRKVGGVVMGLPAEAARATTGGAQMPVADSGASLMAVDSSHAWVRVALNESDLKMVDRSKPGLVLPLANSNGAAGLMAQPVAAPAGNAALPNAAQEGNDLLYYAIDAAGHGLTAGQRVLVQLTLVGGGVQRKLIPQAAVLYDTHGDTWVYTNPEPLVFVRQRISINYMEGDLAVLFAGPSAGTAVVTVGAAELYGAETGVGK